MGPVSFCNTLVEFRGELVPRCNFWYLIDDQPLFIKLAYAGVLFAGFLVMSYIFFKLAYKKIAYHKNRPYKSKDIRMLTYYIFLFVVFFVPAVLFAINLIKSVAFR